MKLITYTFFNHSHTPYYFTLYSPQTCQVTSYTFSTEIVIGFRISLMTSLYNLNGATTSELVITNRQNHTHVQPARIQHTSSGPGITVVNCHSQLQNKSKHNHTEITQENQTRAIPTGLNNSTNN
jgi:hypothetical protein